MVSVANLETHTRSFLGRSCGMIGLFCGIPAAWRAVSSRERCRIFTLRCRKIALAVPSLGPIVICAS